MMFLVRALSYLIDWAASDQSTWSASLRVAAFCCRSTFPFNHHSSRNHPCHLSQHTAICSHSNTHLSLFPGHNRLTKHNHASSLHSLPKSGHPELCRLHQHRSNNGRKSLASTWMERTGSHKRVSQRVFSASSRIGAARGEIYLRREAASHTGPSSLSTRR